MSHRELPPRNDPSHRKPPFEVPIHRFEAPRRFEAPKHRGVSRHRSTEAFRGTEAPRRFEAPKHRGVSRHRSTEAFRGTEAPRRFEAPKHRGVSRHRSTEAVRGTEAPRRFEAGASRRCSQRHTQSIVGTMPLLPLSPVLLGVFVNLFLAIPCSSVERFGWTQCVVWSDDRLGSQGSDLSIRLLHRLRVTFFSK